MESYSKREPSGRPPKNHRTPDYEESPSEVWPAVERAAHEYARATSDTNRKPKASLKAMSRLLLALSRLQNSNGLSEGQLSELVRRALVRAEELKSEISNDGVLPGEILPCGKWARLSKSKASSLYLGRSREVDPDRFDFIESLSPTARYRGTHLSSRRYIVFEFENIVVADSPHVGNALYLLKKQRADWQEVFTLPKMLAIKRGAERICHGTDDTWKRVVRKRLSASTAAQGRSAIDFTT